MKGKKRVTVTQNYRTEHPFFMFVGLCYYFHSMETIYDICKDWKADSLMPIHGLITSQKRNGYWMTCCQLMAPPPTFLLIPEARWSRPRRLSMPRQTGLALVGGQQLRPHMPWSWFQMECWKLDWSHIVDGNLRHRISAHLHPQSWHKLIRYHTKMLHRRFLRRRVDWPTALHNLILSFHKLLSESCEQLGSVSDPGGIGCGYENFLMATSQ